MEDKSLKKLDEMATKYFVAEVANMIETSALRLLSGEKDKDERTRLKRVIDYMKWWVKQRRRSLARWMYDFEEECW